MSQKVIGTAFDSTAKNLGEFNAGIRIDVSPVMEMDKITGEGNFYPFTLDQNGFLRVVLPESQVTSQGNDLLVEVRDLLRECRDLLMKIA